jgi:hypothetical protein
MRISERKVEFPKLPFELFRREFIIEHPVVIVLNNNATLVKKKSCFGPLESLGAGLSIV